MQIRINRLHKSFGEHRVLNDISLDVDDCHSLVIVAPSGGGKTTLLRVIAGLKPADSGSLVVSGRPVAFEEKSLREHRKHVGLVFQAYNLFPHLTALGKGAWNSFDESSRSCHESPDPVRRSGGQKQRIALSRATLR